MTDAEWIFRQGEARGATKASALFFVINTLLFALVLFQGDKVRAYFQGVHQPVRPCEQLREHGAASGWKHARRASVRGIGCDLPPRGETAPVLEGPWHGQAAPAQEKVISA